MNFVALLRNRFVMFVHRRMVLSCCACPAQLQPIVQYRGFLNPFGPRHIFLILLCASLRPKTNRRMSAGVFVLWLYRRGHHVQLGAVLDSGRFRVPPQY